MTNHPPTKQHEEVLYGAVESAIEHAGNVKDDISYNVGDRLDDFRKSKNAYFSCTMITFYAVHFIPLLSRQEIVFCPLRV